MSDPEDPQAVPAAWPALIALAIVVVLSIGTLGVDLYVDHQTADTTAELTEDSLRSVALADDLRYQAYRLSTVHLTPDQIASIAEQIDVDARAFDPLATSADETAEWQRLEGLLAHLRHEQPLAAADGSLVPQIETSIARLISINQADARRAARAISDAHADGLVIDGVVGGITLVLAALVALALVRMLRRQRELLRVHLASLDARTRELAQFASRTAHDLKQPLSPIRGYADVLTMHADPEVAEPARRIARAVARMTGVLEGMLALATAGRLETRGAPVAAVVREVLDELGGELAACGARVTVEVDDRALAACPPALLAGALHNVIGNAVKYRAEDRPLVLDIAAHVVAGAVRIVVADNGRGMDAARAFERGYRADPALPGHGLGLANVQRSLAGVGGTAQLASTPGSGTTVTLALPIPA